MPLAIGVGTGVSWAGSVRPVARYRVTSADSTPDTSTDVIISAQLLNADGTNDATPGVTVTWTKYGSGGSLSAATSDTDAGGLATITLTVSGVAGTVHAVRATDSSGRTGVTTGITVQVSVDDRFYLSDEVLSTQYLSDEVLA